MATLFLILRRKDEQGFSEPLFGTGDPQIVRRVLETIHAELMAAYQEHETDWRALRLLSSLQDPEGEEREP